MQYKDLIIRMLDKITSEKVLEEIYTIIMWYFTE